MNEKEFKSWWFDMNNVYKAYDSIGKYADRDRVEKEMMKKLALYQKKKLIAGIIG